MFYDKELYRYEKALKRMSKSYIPIDYEYKSKILKNDLVSLMKSVSRVEYNLVLHDHYDNYQLRNWLYKTFGSSDVLESIRIDDAYRHKSKRLEKRIRKIIYDHEFSCFVTFTFDDKHLKNNNDESKRKAVRRWLKKYCSDYVANVDYGEKNGRIHYHAVVSADCKLDNKTWTYGAINFKKIVKFDEKALTQYVNKLTNHALKESAKRQVLIYKKNS